MKIKYIDLIEQTFDWPQEEFRLRDAELEFHGIPLMEMIETYGTPLKFHYLPKISENIQKAKRWFGKSMEKLNYEGNYNYCYCTKSSHFSFVLEEVLKNDTHIETSSAYDLNIVERLLEKGIISKDRYIVCNGFKRDQYLVNIARLINEDKAKVIPVIDNFAELDTLCELIDKPFDIGLRIASEEEPKFEFYTSRLGIGYKNIIQFYRRKIETNPKVTLKMLHFFINTGINDTAYYWSELNKCLNVYVDLKEIVPELDSLNIGGGFPIKNSMVFSYDYEYMVEEILTNIKQVTNDAGVKEPHIFTEFGSFTVGESAGLVYKILYQKQQNDREKWNMIDGSFMTTLPDSWAISKRFIMLPVNNWDKEYERVLLGGLTCDSDDYYNSEQHSNAIFLPKFNPQRPLYIGFFNTGAYQDTIGGYGGLQHCLIPNPKHILVQKDENGEFTFKVFRNEQTYTEMLNILGY